MGVQHVLSKSPDDDIAGKELRRRFQHTSRIGHSKGQRAFKRLFWFFMLLNIGDFLQLNDAPDLHLSCT